jgi:hypothetical protein
MRQDVSFLYTKENTGYLVTLRGDFAEMTKVDVVKHRSEYIRLEAPIQVIRQSVRKLVKQGYKLSQDLELSWRSLAC